jgi:hypothetical protein
VRIEDVEAAASVHQHLGEPGVPDDRVDHQRVLARIGDAVRVIFAAEGDGVLRPVKEGGRSLLRDEDSCRSRLRWLLDMSTVGPPKMRKTFSTAGKPPASLSPHPSWPRHPSRRRVCSIF